MTTSPFSVAYRGSIPQDLLGTAPWQFQHLSRWQALIGGLGDGAQALEDVAFDLVDQLNLDSAAGAMLDRLGGLVGEPRGPLGDLAYRRFIRARALITRCQGTVEELLEVWRTLMDVGAEFAWEVECFPAGVDLVAVRPSFLPDTEYRRVFRAMQDAKPAGVTLTLVEAVGDYHGPKGSRFSSPPTALISRLIHEAGP